MDQSLGSASSSRLESSGEFWRGSIRLSEPAASHGAHSRQVGGNCADPRGVLVSHHDPVDLVLQVHKVLLVRARRTTGLASFVASREASEQESSVDNRKTLVKVSPRIDVISAASLKKLPIHRCRLNDG